MEVLLITNHCVHKSPPRGTGNRPFAVLDAELSGADSGVRSSDGESDNSLGEGSSSLIEGEGASVENSLRVRFVTTNVQLSA